MNKTALLELADRIEKAEGLDWELFWDAFYLVFPSSNLAYTPEWYDWRTKQEEFRDLIDAGEYGYIGAAMMLVPEGWDWSVGVESLEGFPAAWGNLNPQTQPFPVELDITTEAATPALALTAASLRAHASGGDDES